jgi:hypothetical protein
MHSILRPALFLLSLVAADVVQAVNLMKAPQCNYFTLDLSPRSIVTRPRGETTLIDKYSYFTFEKDQVAFAVGTSDYIKNCLV